MPDERETRAEHLAFCKWRALAYLDDAQPRPAQALASMTSDLAKHPETASLAGLFGRASMQLIMAGNGAAIRRLIEDVK